MTVFDNPDSEFPVQMELYTEEEFEEQMHLGVLGPEDGVGYWADANGNSSTVTCWDPAPEGFTFVRWFNK